MKWARISAGPSSLGWRAWKGARCCCSPAIPFITADRFSIRYAWPSAYWGSLPLEGGIEAAYRAEIDAADDPAAKLKEIEDRLNKLRSPFRSAEKFWVEEIIDPRKTRSLLCEFARLAEPLRKAGPPGNMTIRP